MNTLTRDIWLCVDCMVLHETGDASSFDGYYSGGDDPEGEACRRLADCEQGLERLSAQGHLVSDNTENDGDCRECHTCGHINDADSFAKVEETDDEDEHYICPACGSFETSERYSGREEFSRRGCDCCDSNLAGSMYRYALLGTPGEGDQLALPTDADDGTGGADVGAQGATGKAPIRNLNNQIIG